MSYARAAPGEFAPRRDRRPGGALLRVRARLATFPDRVPIALVPTEQSLVQPRPGPALPHGLRVAPALLPATHLPPPGVGPRLPARRSAPVRGSPPPRLAADECPAIGYRRGARLDRGGSWRLAKSP